MANPILGTLALNAMAGRIGPIKQMLSTLQAAQNPQAALAQMAQSNPIVQQAMQLAQQSGGDAKAAFYQLARQNGIDPEQVLSMLK